MMKFLFLVFATALSASALSAQRTLPREDYVTRVESCEAILREFQSNSNIAIPREVLQRARAVVITNQFKGGFFLGIKDGYGVILVKKPDGQWSVPAHLNAGEASLGLQIGGTTIETVYIITDDQTPRLLFNQRFNIGADAKAVIGPAGAHTERVNEAILTTPVIVYSKSTGFFAGAAVKAGWIQRNDSANRQFYNTEFTLPEILYSNWIEAPAEVRPLMNYVRELTD